MKRISVENLKNPGEENGPVGPLPNWKSLRHEAVRRYNGWDELQDSLRELREERYLIAVRAMKKILDSEAMENGSVEGVREIINETFEEIKAELSRMTLEEDRQLW